jgi:hypothetical protein
MPFADRFTEVYEQVYRPCCEAAGVRCWRVDEVAGPGSITTDIINGILESEFLIADLTTQNPNVFYELGIAHALAKDVILTCQTIEDVPFDVRSSRVLVYSQTIRGAAVLKDGLLRAIKAVDSDSQRATNPVQDALRLRSLAENRLLHEPKIDGRLVQPNSASSAAPTSESLAVRIDAARVESALGRIHAALEQIADPKREEDKILIEANGRTSFYVQFAADKAAKSIYGESVSNEHLEPHDRLPPELERKLESDGWERPDGKDYVNFHREWDVRDSHDLRMIALESVRALADVYKVHDLDRLRISVFE